MAVLSTNSRTPLLFRWFAAAGSLGRCWPALLVFVAALALSLLGIYAIDIAEVHKPLEGAWGPSATRQMIYLGVSLLFFLIAILPPYRFYGSASWVLLALCVLFLIFLLIPGVPVSIVRPRNGARSWIDFGRFDFQPSEVTKIAYVLVVAWYLRFRKNHRTFTGLIPPAIITFIPVGLITLQPDLGTAMLFIPALFAILVAAGAKLKHLILIVALAIAAAPAAYLVLKPHQKARIDGMVLQLQGDTSGDQDINMQSRTAQRLAGAGGHSGLTEDHSRTLLYFNALPERKTDMIFSVICNRFGWLGGMGVLGLYGLWFLGTLLCAATCREPFGRLICVGFAGFMAAQIYVGIGMSIGIVPIIGITLPYLSLGGSSLVVMWLMVGLMFNISLRKPSVSLRRSFEYEDEG